MSEIVTVKNPPSVKVIAPQISVVSDPHVDSYAYPILSQTTSYRDGDEGWQIANVWNSIYGDGNTERVAVAELSDFYTLKTNNQFGNTSRFTNSIGGSPPNMEFSIGDFNVGNICYDNYLGIQFIVFPQKTTAGYTDWNSFIDYVRSYDDGSWYPVPAHIYSLLDDKEEVDLNSVIKHGGNIVQTSTTYRADTSRSLYYYRSIQNIIAKTGSFQTGFGYKLI